MSMTTKQKKKLTKWVGSTEERLKIVFTDRCIEYFVLFCFILLFDQIAAMFHLFAVINYHKGIGWLQLTGAFICLIQIIRYAWKAS